MMQQSTSQHRAFEGAACLIDTPAAFAVSPDDLSQWVANVAAGQMCVYARAALLPRGVAARARQLMVQGLIALERNRHTKGSELFDFAARRSALPIEQARPIPTDTALPPECKLLLEELVRLADSGSECPANDALSARIGVRGGNPVSKHLARLIASHLIRVERHDIYGLRRVEILESGAMTGWGHD